MKATIKGLKRTDTTIVESCIAEMYEGDLLAYGLNLRGTDDATCNELFAVENMARTALVGGYTHLLVVYTKLYAAHSKDDLMPELENVEFDGNSFYMEVLERCDD